VKGLDFAEEKKGWSRGFVRIAGVDEAGRGPLAGPVIAAACVFPAGAYLAGLNDSKKLSAARREALYEVIREMADVGVGIISEKTIDEINIFQAARLAMKQAVLSLEKSPECVWIDGNARLDLAFPQQTFVGGDGLIASIAAASIIAKVTRDKLMLQYHEIYPQYGFDKHKGYPSPAHLNAIRLHGFSPIHRMSFKPKALRDLVLPSAPVISHAT
jgi:ribonuclease HII